MCGIVGYLGQKQAGEIILAGLKRLEYRGYDSAGIATLDEEAGDFRIRKDVGQIDDIDTKLDFADMAGSKGIGHTRWATHGGVTKENAHPHRCCSGRISIVHNGIIENYKELKQQLNHHQFTSETDSELVAHYFSDKLEAGASPREIMAEFIDQAQGTFAILVLDNQTGKIYALKRDSPLALGLGQGEKFIASDIYAFSPHTSQAIFFEDEDYAIISEDHFQFYNKGEEIEKEIEEFEWGSQEESKAQYPHWMLKEIQEQPEALAKLKSSLSSSQKGKLQQLAAMIRDHEKVIFVAAGTSYHASLLGVYLLQRAGIEAQALIASEFKNYERVDDSTLIIAVSQSGETMDTIESIKFSKKKDGTIASIVNVPHSSIERESELSLQILAGQEKCVAATKTFTNQVFLLLSLAEKFNANVEFNHLIDSLKTVIDNNEGKIERLAEKLKNCDDIYLIGRGPSYPIAREIALKLKEIAYVHAEGMMGGELKHGTLALIEDGVPVISLIPEKEDEILSNVKEVESRGAHSIKISPYYGQFEVPEDGESFAIIATTIGFLLAYYLAKEKGLPIDKPRNLAKSVTVK